MQFVDAGRLNALAQSDEHQGRCGAGRKQRRRHWRGRFDSVLAASLKAPPPLFLLLEPDSGSTQSRRLHPPSADAFGADAVDVAEAWSAPLSAVALKAGSGATETTPVCYVNNLVQCIETLQAEGIWVLAPRWKPTRRCSTALIGPIAWVMGNEGKGLRRLTRERCDALVAIPMMGAVESLNVSVATAVCLPATTQAARARSGRCWKVSNHKAETRSKFRDRRRRVLFVLRSWSLSHARIRTPKTLPGGTGHARRRVRGFLAVQLRGRSGQPDAGQDATPEQKELRESLGLDQPDYVQFAVFVKNAVKGDSDSFAEAGPAHPR